MKHPDLPVHEVHAIRYARHERTARDNFVGGDPHENHAMPMDYFVWVVRGPERVLVVDTGFNARVAAARGREFLRCPVASLALLGIEPQTVEDVVITHLHYDHVGNFDRFPSARFHVQDREVSFATGRHMRHASLRAAYEAHDVAEFVLRVFEERVVFHDGDETLYPGISLHWVGGHTAGLQVVRVHTRKGWLVLASDASHYYANMEGRRPFPIVYNVGEMLEGHEKVYRLADSADLVIPGHDPAVMARFPAASAELAGIIARLD
ncbi:N-acyl homoserine lactonase family protein [Castellaniella sp.]|uniref:N-acyl homoserine lactonase family protein n=1 Tax=Castellaniella sp. TaxID=1955812 RepID=UPI00355E5524